MALIKLPKSLHNSQPRTAPLGDVEIDWTNPLARGLSVFTMFNNDAGTGINELVDKIPYDDGTNNINGVGFIREKSAMGRCVRSVKSESDELRLHPDRAIPGGRATTVLTGVNYDAGNTDGTLIHIGSSVAAANQPLIWADTASSVLRPSFNSGGGSLVGTSGSIPSGQFTIWGASFTASNPATVGFYVDGVNRGSGNAGNTSSISAIPWRYANDGSGGRGVNGDIYFYAVWDRELTPAEHKAFSGDPYQIVKPKKAAFYFTGTAPVGGVSIPVIMNQLRNQGIN